MYSYKLNNSYTVYVNWQYINEVRKVCHPSRKIKPTLLTTTVTPKQPQNMIIRQKVAPLPNGTKLQSRHYGIGTLLSTEHDIMYIAFEGKTVRFEYPTAIEKGYLIESNFNNT